MGYDIVSGISSAVSGATPKDSGSSSDTVRKNKTKALPMPDTYGGAGDSAGSYKRGGKVKRTGHAKVHKGERVLTAKQARKYAKKKGRK